MPDKTFLESFRGSKHIMFTAFFSYLHSPNQVLCTEHPPGWLESQQALQQEYLISPFIVQELAPDAPPHSQDR